MAEQQREPARCECRLGFCRMITLADAFADVVMAGDTEAATRLSEEYKRQAARCAWGNADGR